MIQPGSPALSLDVCLMGDGALAAQERNCAVTLFQRVQVSRLHGRIVMVMAMTREAAIS